MKKIIAFCSAVLLLSSCAMVKSPVIGFVYTNTKAPVTVTENPVGSKKGKASAVSILGWVALGNASVQKAAKEAGITKISHVDEKSTGVLGLFAKYTVTVYGE